jgi:ribonuclease T2
MQKHPKQITPAQYLVVAVILILAAIFRIQGIGNGELLSDGPTPTILPDIVVAPTLTDIVPSSDSTRTPRPTVEQLPTETVSVAESSLPTDHLSQFDFYVLSLSWSPDYCATSGNNDPQQCSLGKKLGFVLHGLWPQYVKGYPSNCSTEKMPDSVKAQFPGLYPNDNLFDHEWEKHGTCTGLTPVEYLQAGKTLKESVNIPGEFRSPEKPFRTTMDQLKELFAQANPGFSPDGIEVSCSGSGKYLKEIYVCFAPDGTATPCSAEMHKTALKSCQAKDFLVRNTR